MDLVGRIPDRSQDILVLRVGRLAAGGCFLGISAGSGLRLSGIHPQCGYEIGSCNRLRSRTSLSVTTSSSSAGLDIPRISRSAMPMWGMYLLDVGALLFLLDLPAARADVGRQPAPAVLESQAQLPDDLRVGGDRLLALGGERDPDGGDVHEEHHRSGRAALPWIAKVRRMRQSMLSTALVMAQEDCWYCSGTRLAKRSRSTRSSRGQAPPVGHADLDQEGIAAVDRGRA